MFYKEEKQADYLTVTADQKDKLTHVNKWNKTKNAFWLYTQQERQERDI